MRKLFSALAVGLLVLGGCTSSQTAVDTLYERWAGRHSDEFFIQYGMPFKQFQLDDGGKLFAWSSGVKSYTMPSTTTYQGTVGPYGTYSGTGTTTGGGTLDLICDLQIQTNAELRITAITFTRDSMGPMADRRRSSRLMAPTTPRLWPEMKMLSGFDTLWPRQPLST